MKKINYSKWIVALIIILNALFTASTLIVFAMTSTEPSTLILSWFAFTTGELWLVAGIKKSKVKSTADIEKIEARKRNCDEDSNG